MVTFEEAIFLEEEKKKAGSQMQIDVLSWLKINYPGAKGLRLSIRHLWDDYYRLNYWGKKEDGDEVIKTSIFAKVEKNNGGFKLDCRNKDEVKWNLVRRNNND